MCVSMCVFAFACVCVCSLFRAKLEGQGTYECVLTGLIFEASEGVLVRYSILSWSKFNKFLQEPWMIAGPIFNVHTVNKDPSAIKLIQLPHCLCLAGEIMLPLYNYSSLLILSISCLFWLPLCRSRD